jgi:hypothetical protein
MKQLFILVFFMLGLASADAQSCTPCPPQCAAVCKPGKAVSASASLLPMEATETPACTPAEMAACAKVCTPEQIAACLDGKKVSKKDCAKACSSKKASGCTAPAAAQAPSAEKQIDRTYHAVPTPTKS